jgi:hypothetical protein
MTAHPTLSLVEQLRTAGAVATVPVSQADGSLLMTLVGDVRHEYWLKNGFPDRTQSTLIWTDSGPDRTLSIQPTGASFEYLVEGIVYTSTGDTVQITDVEGVHWIYYEGATLKAIANPTTLQESDLIKTKTPVSVIYWDKSAATAIYVGEERHGISMSPDTHAYHHFIDGLRYANGLGLNTLSVDGTGVTADAQFGVDAGLVADEDLPSSIASIASTTGLPIYYMTGSGGDWNKHIESGFSVRTYDGTSGTRLAWNEWTGSAWQLSEVGSNLYVLCHVFATTEKDTQMIAVMGQNSYANKPQAQAGSLVEIQTLVLGGLPLPEFRPIATLIFQTNLGYANAVNAKVVSTADGDDYVDWRSEVVARAIVSTTDHGSLTGRGDDDHTHYALVDGTRAFTGTVTAPDMTLNGVTPTIRLNDVDLSRPAAGVLLISEDFDTSYPRIVLGAEDASHPAIIRNADDIELKKGDMSARAGLIAQKVSITNADYLSWIGRGKIGSSDTDRITLWNSDWTDFGMLQFGGTSNTEPGLLKSGATLQCKLADNSTWTSFHAGALGIGTSTVPYLGVGLGIVALHGPASDATGPHVQYTTAADGYPLFQQLNWSHDNIAMLFDSFYAGGGVWKSSDVGSNFRIYKNVDQLKIHYDSGVALNGTIAWNEALAIDTAGKFTIGGQVQMPSLGIGTATVPHAGIGSGIVAIEGTGFDYAGPHLQITTTADDYPLFQLLNWSHDNVSLNFDSYYGVGGWKSSSSGFNGQIIKSSDGLKVRYNSGTTVGNTFSWSESLKLGTTGRLTFTGTTDTEQLVIKAYSGQTLANPLIQLQDSSGTPLLDINSNDPTNVLIGVGAGVAITTATYVIAIGDNAAGSQIGNGSNVAIGHNALYSNQYGSKVVAIGQSCMQNYQGSNAVGIGYSAGTYQTGGQCVYIGREAGKGVSGSSTGENHTCVGYFAGNALTTADHCTLVGYMAGKALTASACSYSTAIGKDALLTMSNGAGNTAGGYYALRLAASGSHNCAWGYDAAGRILGGEKNTSLGNFAGRGTIGYSLSEGTHVGYASGVNLTTGSGNCLYGYYAAGNLTSGSYNIIIGYDLDASSPTVDYELNIGDAIKGDLSNGDIAITRHLEIDGDLNHDGSNIGFFGTSPTGQAAALTTALTQISHTGPTTPDYAIATPVSSGAGATWGFSTQDEFETVMSVILNLQTRVDQLESKLQAYGLLQ